MHDGVSAAASMSDVEDEAGEIAMSVVYSAQQRMMACLGQSVSVSEAAVDCCAVLLSLGPAGLIDLVYLTFNAMGFPWRYKHMY